MVYNQTVQLFKKRQKTFYIIDIEGNINLLTKNKTTLIIGPNVDERNKIWCRKMFNVAYEYGDVNDN